MFLRFSSARAFALIFVLLTIPALACDFSFAVGGTPASPTVAAPTVKVELPAATQTIVTASRFQHRGIQMENDNTLKGAAVRGTVYDAQGQPLANVGVTLQSTGTTMDATTNRGGSYLIRVNDNGDYLLFIGGDKNSAVSLRLKQFDVANVDWTVLGSTSSLSGTLTTPTTRAQVATPQSLSTAVLATSVPKASGGGIITEAVLAREITPLVSAPLGITDTFPPDGKIHVNLALLNAPSGTSIRAIWSTVNATGVQPNAEITRYQTTVQGSRFVDIVFYGTSRLPVGTYKIDVFLNDKLDRTLNLSVKEGVAAFHTPTPRAAGNCPPPPTPAYRPPLIARKITMAEGVKSDTAEPTNATRVFKPTSVFHAIVELENAPANSKIKSVWYALDTGGLEPCNTRLGEVEVTTSGGNRTVWSNFKPPSTWPLGLYKVEIYVNDAMNIDVDFRVQ